MIVIVELPDPGAGIGFGLKLTVVPDGTPEADRVIALLNPPLIAVVIVDVPWLPCPTLREAGEAAIVKFACAVTVRPVEPLMEPEVAWMVVLPAASRWLSRCY